MMCAGAHIVPPRLSRPERTGPKWMPADGMCAAVKMNSEGVGAPKWQLMKKCTSTPVRPQCMHGVLSSTRRRSRGRRAAAKLLTRDEAHGASPPTSPSRRGCSLVGESVAGAVAARASDNAGAQVAQNAQSVVLIRPNWRVRPGPVGRASVRPGYGSSRPGCSNLRRSGGV